MGNQYINRFLKVVVFILVISTLDLISGTLLRNLYFRQDSGVLSRTTYSIEGTKEDLLIFGSSRANHHYDPEIIKEEMGISCYNAGRDGCPIFYHYAVLQGVLKRYKPKAVILDFNLGEFAQGHESYDRISALLPYFKGHPEIRSVVNLKSNYERIKLLSACYPFNSYLLTIINGIYKSNSGKTDIADGFIPLDKVLNEPLHSGSTMAKYELDNNKIATYKSFIEDCLNSKINICIVVSPYYIDPELPDPSIVKGKEIAEEYNIDFLDYSSDTYYLNNPSLFADFAHLNNEGATIFTEMLIRRIKEELQRCITSIDKSDPDENITLQ